MREKINKAVHQPKSVCINTGALILALAEVVHFYSEKKQKCLVTTHYSEAHLLARLEI